MMNVLERQLAERIVHQAIERVNEVRLEENLVSPGADTILMGEGATLDSMGFVNFVVALEEEFAAQTGVALNLAERLNALTARTAPVRTVNDLVDFLVVQTMQPPGQDGPALVSN